MYVPAGRGLSEVVGREDVSCQRPVVRFSVTFWSLKELALCKKGADRRRGHQRLLVVLPSLDQVMAYGLPSDR